MYITWPHQIFSIVRMRQRAYIIYRRIRTFIINCQIITSKFYYMEMYYWTRNITTAEHWAGGGSRFKNLNYIFPVRIDHYRNIALEIKLFIGLSFDNNNNFTNEYYILCAVCATPDSVYIDIDVDMHNGTVAWWWWQINISDICFIYHFAIKWKLLMWLCVTIYSMVRRVNVFTMW